MKPKAWAFKDEIIARLGREAGGNPARLIAWAREAGMEASEEEIDQGYVTWYTAAEYLADRELERWL